MIPLLKSAVWDSPQVFFVRQTEKCQIVKVSFELQNGQAGPHIIPREDILMGPVSLKIQQKKKIGLENRGRAVQEEGRPGRTGQHSSEEESGGGPWFSR